MLRPLFNAAKICLFNKELKCSCREVLSFKTVIVELSHLFLGSVVSADKMKDVCVKTMASAANCRKRMDSVRESLRAADLYIVQLD